MINIGFFRTNSGNCPVEEFLDNLTSKQTQKVVCVMQLIEEFDRIPEQYFKKLSNTNGIWEIRAQFGSDTFRILGFFENRSNFFATNGFLKKTRKTPQNEIALTENRKQLFYKLKEKNNERFETVY